MLQKNTADSELAAELFNITVKRLNRRKMAPKASNKLIPKGRELQLH